MKRLKFPAALIVTAAILLRPEAAATGAQRAMRVWYTSVAPSLFPFLVMMPLLTGSEACAVYDRLFGRVMRPLFHLSGSAASAMAVGMLSGSPCGAMAVRRIAAQGNLSAPEARRLALCVCGVSPAYLIYGVGGMLFGSVRTGFHLAVAQLAAQIFLLILTRDFHIEGKEILQEDLRQISPVRNAVETIVCICGYMTFFSALAEVMTCFLSHTAGSIFLMFADLPSGLHALAESAYSGKLLIAGAIVGFGGLCIGMQNLDVLKTMGIRRKQYFFVRIIAAAVCACFCARRKGVSFEPGIPRMSNPAVLSILIALALGIPALIYLSKKPYFNKQKKA